MKNVTFPKIKKEHNQQGFLQDYYKSLSEQEQAEILVNELATITELQSQIEMRQQRVLALKIAQSAGK
jgi:hypothetical protein